MKFKMTTSWPFAGCDDEEEEVDIPEDIVAKGADEIQKYIDGYCDEGWADAASTVSVSGEIIEEDDDDYEDEISDSE